MIEKINFAYRGGRDYIDMAQISEKFLQAIERLGIPNDLIRDYFARMVAPIRHHALLVEHVAEADKSRILVRFKFKLMGQAHSYFMIRTEKVIHEKEPDPDFDGDNLIFSSKDRIFLNPNHDYTKYVFCYLLIRMGREYAIRILGSEKPQAVEGLIQRIPTPDTFSQFSLIQATGNKQGFSKIIIFLAGENLGHTILVL